MDALIKGLENELQATIKKELVLAMVQRPNLARHRGLPAACATTFKSTQVNLSRK